MKNAATCLVTGGAGFIGSHLCDALLNKKYKVVCVDNLLTGNKKNIAHLLKNPSFQFYQQDITRKLSSDFLNRHLKDIRFLYHLASPASPPKYRKYSIETLLVNSVGTYNILEIIKSKKITFLFTSTSEIYGDPKEHPQKESYFGNVNPIGPRSCYDESKRFGESMVVEYVRKYDCDARIVRIFNTYGPRMEADDGRVISNFINQAINNNPLTIYGDGEQTRSFCFISDMVRGITKVMEEKGLKGEVINLGYPNERTINSIADTVLKMTSSKSKKIYSKLPQDDPVKRRPDISKAEELLFWKPQVSLEEGLKSTIEYFKSV